ncbi:MAG TPA: undecaprenyl-diphosphate phosphatase [Pseudonocardiaceae bacterium]|jgi:undecaprenyl-diphosphatase|nr:undecaprenyl-diphosphate phosphatase [Pseudonocardiaceae bacterium]
MSALSYPEMIFIGLLQGVSELFPVSSLGHAVVVPALIGGQWAKDMSMGENSPYLAALVAMHVATAAALVIFFWRDWIRIIGGLFTSIRHRRVDTPDQRLAWLLVLATIPVGIAGLALDKVMTNYLGKPIPAAAFLALNGAVLFGVERLQRGRRFPAEPAEQDITWPAADPEPGPAAAGPHEETMVMSVLTNSANRATSEPESTDPAIAIDARLSRLSVKEAVGIGVFQAAALLPGISRSGITMVGGLLRGLRHEDAARFAFLLIAPVMLGAGLYKIPELLHPQMRASLGPVLLGSLLAGIAAYLSVRFLTRYFETRTLNPFAIYCVIAGLGSLAFFAFS